LPRGFLTGNGAAQCDYAAQGNEMGRSTECDKHCA